MCTEIDVLLDAKAEVAHTREVLLVQFVLFHLQTALENLLGLRAAHSAVHGDLLIAANAERSHRVAS